MFFRILNYLIMLNKCNFLFNPFIIFIMLANFNKNFEQLIIQLNIDQCYQKFIKQGSEMYKIKQYNVQNLTSKKIIQMYDSINTKFYSNRSSLNAESWYQNELRVYIWLLVCYAFVQQKNISQLITSDWVFFSSIFNNRDPDIFQYQSLSLIKGKEKGKWDQEEKNILGDLMNSKNMKNKWNEIAKELFYISGKRFFRTSKQCRQFWFNHLNPVIMHTSWTIYEDLQLLKGVLEEGKKWSRVSKYLGEKRTAHMIKNRYKSLCHSKFREEEGQLNDKKQKRIVKKLINQLHESIKQKQQLRVLESTEEWSQVRSQIQNINPENDFGKMEIFSLIDSEEEIEKLKQQNQSKITKSIEFQFKQIEQCPFQEQSKLFENLNEDYFNMFLSPSDNSYYKYFI